MNDREPVYGLVFSEAQELALSEAEWTYTWDDETESGGWTDPQDDGDDPVLYSAQAAHRVYLSRRRPIATRSPTSWSKQERPHRAYFRLSATEPDTKGIRPKH